MPVAVALIVLLPLALWLGRGLRMLELGDDTGPALGVPCRADPARVRRGRRRADRGGHRGAGPIAFIALAAPADRPAADRRRPAPAVLPRR